MDKWKLTVIDVSTENDFLRNYSLYKNNVDIYNNANNILIPSLMCYHTCYPDIIIDSFNTTL
jgi:hypothetical protein